MSETAPDDTPTLEGYVTPRGVDVVVWCDHCHRHHYHGHHRDGTEGCRFTGGQDERCTCPLGTGNGHRVAHCHDRQSPYDETGYIVREAGHIFDAPGGAVRLTRVSGPGHDTPVPAQPPTAAVEASAHAIAQYDHEKGYPGWDELPRDEQGMYRSQAESAVLAAAPMIRAQVLREAATAVEARREIVGSLIAIDEAIAVIRHLAGDATGSGAG